MRVLAVDTTTARGGAALVSDEGVLAEARVRTTDGHSRWLLGAVEALLCGVGIAAQELDAFAVSIGPGSFTGLRVGLSSVQGLALASGRPCVGLSALELLARSALGAGEALVAVMDAFRGECYVGLHDARGQAVGVPRVGVVEQIAGELPAGAVFVGEAAVERRTSLERLVPGACFAEAPPFLAALLGRAALERVRQGLAVAASELRPLYLRGAGIRSSRA